MECNETKAGVSPVLSTGGLAGKAFIDPEVLEQAAMTPDQQAQAEQGFCPKCYGVLLTAHRCEGMSFNQCQQCKDIWVLPANAEVTGGGAEE